MKKSQLLFAVATLLLGTTASAMPITYTFIADGVTENASQQGTAVFTFDTADLSTFTLTLSNNVDPTVFIASELDGFEFTFSEAPATLSLLQNGVSPVAVIDCTSGVNPCPAGTGTSPYGWGTTLTGADAALGAGIKS